MSLLVHHPLPEEGRIVCWISYGAASAVAGKMALDLYGDRVILVNCEVKEEHEDNKRFHKDLEKWYNKEIIILGNDKYNRSAEEVWLQTKFLIGINGARCTGELKKSVRHEFQKVDDIVVLGFTADEQHRQSRLSKSEPFTTFWPILLDNKITKKNCLDIIRDAGIELPMMYKLGYKNNNCIGCVKGGMGYWNKIRVDFPERFKRMSEIERELGISITKELVSTDETGKRKYSPVFLDELDPGRGTYKQEPEWECGILCSVDEEDK